MENRYKVVLDFKQNTLLHINFVQNDSDSSILEFIITDNGLIVDISDQDISVAFLKPDNTIVIQDHTNGVNILDSQNGKLECVLKSNTLAAVGIVQAEISFKSGTKKLSTATFSFNVSSSIDNGDGVLSSNDIAILDSKILEAENKIEEMGTVIEEAKTATDNANYAADNANDILAEIETPIKNLQIDFLQQNNIKGTTQSIIFSNKKIKKIQHVTTSLAILREDVFTYTGNIIIEVRTLSTGEKLTLRHHLNILKTEVI